MATLERCGLAVWAVVVLSGCPFGPEATLVIDNISPDLAIVSIETMGPEDARFRPLESVDEVLPGSSVELALPVTRDCSVWQIRAVGSDGLPCDSRFGTPSLESELTIFRACRGETYTWIWGDNSCPDTIFDGPNRKRNEADRRQ